MEKQEIHFWGFWLIFFGFVTSLCSLEAISCRLDLGFILDSSISKSGFDNEIDFVRDVTRHLTISGKWTRVSVMTFASSANMKIYFRDGSARSYNALDLVLRRLTYGGGGSSADKALNLARTHMFSTSFGARHNVPKILILLSDGKSQTGLANLWRAATNLKISKVNVFSIGIGNGIRSIELVTIASTPSNSHVFQVSGAATLSTIVNAVSSRLCVCKTTTKGAEFRGAITTTTSGKICQAWASKTPHQHLLNPSKYPNAGLENNYCRNPDNAPNGPWCFTMDKNVRWEYCAVPSCQVCKTTRKGTEFRGAITTTISGKTCQAWASKTPHQHLLNPSTYPNAGLDNNYCRNPHNDEPNGPWCFTMDKNVRWEYCSVPLCQVTCNYVECKWKRWSDWSATCGSATRTRSIEETSKRVQKASCSGLTRTCTQKLETESRTTMCTCSYVECRWKRWSDWSATCGPATRTRSIEETPTTVQKESCSGLTQTCTQKPETESRTTKCTCSYVECRWKRWSDWSATCGPATRTRSTEETPTTVQKESCSGLTQTCTQKPETESRTTKCTCNYVECKWQRWSDWSATCGSATRTRSMEETPKTVQKESCSGLMQTCTHKSQTESRTTSCTKPPTTPQPTTPQPTTPQPTTPPVPTKKPKAATCHIKYEPLGCYGDRRTNPRPLPELIITDRDPWHPSWSGIPTNWKKWDSYLIDLICRCAAKTQDKRYKFFGLQYFGECWSGPEAGDTYSQDGYRDTCVKQQHKPCQTGNLHCVGKQGTNYVYKIIPN